MICWYFCPLSLLVSYQDAFIEAISSCVLYDVLMLFFFFFTFVPEGWNLRRWEYHCHAHLDFTGFTCVIGVISISALNILCFVTVQAIGCGACCLFVVAAAVLDFSFRMFFLSFSSSSYLCKIASALVVCSFSVWLVDTIGLMQLWIKQTWLDL